MAIIAINIWIFYEEDFNAKLPYCNLTTPTNSAKYSIEFYSLLTLDIIALVVDIFITIVNKKMLKKYARIFGKMYF